MQCGYCTPGLADRRRGAAQPGRAPRRRQDRRRAGRERLPVLHLPADPARRPPRRRAHGAPGTARAGAGGRGAGGRRPSPPPAACRGIRPGRRRRSSSSSPTAWSRSWPRTPRPGPAAGRWAAPDDAWVHVGADGAVTAFTGKVEAGQGTRTALGLLVAEELAVPPGSRARGDGQHRCLPLRPGHLRQPLDAVRGASAPRGGRRGAGGAARGGGGAVRAARRGPDRLRRDRGRPGRGAERRLRRAAGRCPAGREGAVRRAGDPAARLALGRPARPGRPAAPTSSPGPSASRPTCGPTACGTAACCGRPRSAPCCATPTRLRPRRCPG